MYYYGYADRVLFSKNQFFNIVKINMISKVKAPTLKYIIKEVEKNIALNIRNLIKDKINYKYSDKNIHQEIIFEMDRYLVFKFIKIDDLNIRIDNIYMNKINKLKFQNLLLLV